ncbi:MAG: class I SAM-dependent methyltransferase [Candidatus Limnocylindria bacterium]
MLDVRDLSSVADARFDAVVAYGGPLSYAFDQAEACMGEMLRVVRPGGLVVASVMGAIGTLRILVRIIPMYAATGRLGDLKQVMATGDNRLDTGSHPCRMFRWREIEAMIGRLPCALRGASASNFLSSGDPQAVREIEQDPALWDQLLDWEEEFCAEAGALDSGTHLLFAVERR